MQTQTREHKTNAKSTLQPAIGLEKNKTQLKFYLCIKLLPEDEDESFTSVGKCSSPSL